MFSWSGNKVNDFQGMKEQTWLIGILRQAFWVTSDFMARGKSVALISSFEDLTVLY